MIRMLNIAEPIIVPRPTLAAGPNASAVAVNSSGAEEPAARKVAPATSAERPSASLIAYSDGWKNSSQIIAIPMKIQSVIIA